MVYDKLIDYFNSWNRHLSQPDNHLQFDDRGAFGSFRGLRLYSAFQPVFSSDTLRPRAYEALLRARNKANRAIAAAEAFAQAESLDEVVYLDRLCRMVHVINFFTQSGAEGDLFLNVSGRHLMRVDTGHGSVFETLLGHCGIHPTQVVLEILEAHVGDLKHLQEAVTAYRSRGFRVAIDDFGSQNSNFDRLWQLTPDIVKIDRSLIVQAETNPRARRILPKLVDIIHDLGAQIVCEGIETQEQHALALDSGAELLQGFYYARPSPEVLPQQVLLMAEAA